MKKVSKLQLIGLCFLIVYVILGFLIGDLYVELKNGDPVSIFIIVCLILSLIAISYRVLIKKSE